MRPITRKDVDLMGMGDPWKPQCMLACLQRDVCASRRFQDSPLTVRELLSNVQGGICKLRPPDVQVLQQRRCCRRGTPRNRVVLFRCRCRRRRPQAREHGAGERIEDRSPPGLDVRSEVLSQARQQRTLQRQAHKIEELLLGAVASVPGAQAEETLRGAHTTCDSAAECGGHLGEDLGAHLRGMLPKAGGSTGGPIPVLLTDLGREQRLGLGRREEQKELAREQSGEGL
mmetsp:Transcript_92219/g.231950  ORF Transcript_92219/g.231950 Transcript_92219/m.231950 type:complete len:229 (-) Transcript_92219:1616-2302(-)